MERAFYHEHPDVMTLETEVLDHRPGRVLVAASPFFPGGGGQLADRGVIRWASPMSAKSTAASKPWSMCRFGG
jgi:misacylated tRNA(Ala) deacylase